MLLINKTKMLIESSRFKKSFKRADAWWDISMWTLIEWTHEWALKL